MNQSAAILLLALGLLLACKPDQKKTAPTEIMDNTHVQEQSVPEISDTVAKSHSIPDSNNLEEVSIKNAVSNSEDSNKKSKIKKSSIKKSPKIEFESLSYDFGEITEGDKFTYDFIFRNTGDADLEIFSAKGSCGCAQPSFPFIPIKPGESGKIGVRYNSVGKDADQKATIEVLTNATKQPIVLSLEGTVKPDQEEKPE